MPTLSRLAHPVLDSQEPLLATGRSPNNHKGAELVILAPKTAMEAVRLDINQGFIIQRSFSPAIIFDNPVAFEPRHSICRQTRRIRAQKNLESGAISPLEIPFRYNHGNAASNVLFILTPAKANHRSQKYLQTTKGKESTPVHNHNSPHFESISPPINK